MFCVPLDQRLDERGFANLESRFLVSYSGRGNVAHALTYAWRSDDGHDERRRVFRQPVDKRDMEPFLADLWWQSDSRPRIRWRQGVTGG